MTKEQLIQGAAELIHADLQKRGTPADMQICLRLARQMHDLYCGPRGNPDLPPGEVARRFRKRYDRVVADVTKILKG